MIKFDRSCNQVQSHSWAPSPWFGVLLFFQLSIFGLQAVLQGGYDTIYFLLSMRTDTQVLQTRSSSLSHITLINLLRPVVFCKLFVLTWILSIIAVFWLCPLVPSTSIAIYTPRSAPLPWNCTMHAIQSLPCLGFVKVATMISLNCNMDSSKFLHGFWFMLIHGLHEFVKKDTWISLGCYTDLSKLINGFL